MTDVVNIIAAMATSILVAMATVGGAVLGCCLVVGGGCCWMWRRRRASLRGADRDEPPVA